MKRKPPAIVDRTDVELFREAIGEVRRIADHPTPVEKPRPAPEPRMHRRDEVEALAASRRPDEIEAQLLGSEALAYRGLELSERSFRRLKRGEFSVQDEIDLHLLGAREAETLLKRFLSEAVQARNGCVRIIHGKGLRSEAGPVLKAMVDRVLRQHGHVLGFSSAPIPQGGTGAALVLLRVAS